MKTIVEHIEYVKGKPHHVRKRVAFAIATGATTLVALVWAVGSISLGGFAIQGSSFADRTGEGSVIVTNDTADASPSLAGAASVFSNENTPAHIEIVDTTPASPTQKKAEQTIIPF